MIRLCLALSVCILSLTNAFGSSLPTWPHERSDIAPDPAIIWETLPNGFRYALRPNAEPKGRISLRLLVKVGSIHERDDEQGLAHFLEHMAFRSAEDHADGSLLENLQRLGVGFGADNTAFTTYDYTIYHLELPDTTPDTLRTALNVFRHYADGLQFDPEVIDIERGVMLSEMATRDTPAARSANAAAKFITPEARANERRPIGTEYHLRHLQVEQFEAFYRAWYRPERMILTVVGEIEPETVSEAIHDSFATLQARGEARPEPSLKIDTYSDLAEQEVAIHRDPNSVGLGLTLSSASFSPDSPSQHADLVHDLHASLAFRMLQRRLIKQANLRGSSHGPPQAYYGTQLKNWRISSLSLPTKLMSWRLVVRAADQELRRALLYGFTESELRNAKTYYASYYQQQARTAATASSDYLATAIANTVAYDEVFSSPELIATELQPVLQATTLEECNAAFRKAWGDETPRLFISAHSSFNLETAAIAELYDYSRRIEVLPPVDEGLTTFGYTDFGPPGKLVESTPVEDLELSLNRFANGVRYNFKQTDFEADNILINLRVGSGRLTQPKSLPGLDYLANYGLLAGGLGKHDSNEMIDILNGHVINLSFSVGFDAFVFSVNCAPRELTLALQTLTAILQDIEFRPEAMRAARSGYGALFEHLNANPGGPIFQHAPVVLTGGDRRFGVPDYPVIYSRTLPELKEWVQPAFQHGPIEVSIVGDVDFETATQAMAQTLGAIPAREERDPDEVDPLRIPASDGRPIVTTVDASLGQVGIAYYWPVDTVSDVHEERRLGLLGSIVEDRLRKRVREEFGAAYSVTTHFIRIDGFPHQNYFTTYADVEPARADQINNIIRSEIASMRREGMTRDEFERAKQPYLAHRKVDLRTNRYWGYTVLRDAQQHDDRLESARDRAEDTEAIELAEIQALLDRYFDFSAAFTFRTVPHRHP